MLKTRMGSPLGMGHLSGYYVVVIDQIDNNFVSAFGKNSS